MRGKYKTALKKAVSKLEKELWVVKDRKIFDAGVQAAKKEKAIERTFKTKKPRQAQCPKELGCMQQMTWYDGYCSINKTAKNPYRGEF